MTRREEGTGKDSRDVVTGGYDALGVRYREWTDANDPDYREQYTDLLADRLPYRSRIVELGCGPASPHVASLADRHSYIGIDRSIAQLRLAQSTAQRGRFVLADMADVALHPSSVDAVVAFYSIIHLPRSDHAALFHNVASWLRSGGLFVANLGAHDDPGSYDEWIDGVRMFWSFFDAASNERLLRSAGFILERSEVLKNFEDDRDVEFLWILARKS